MGVSFFPALEFCPFCSSVFGVCLGFYEETQIKLAMPCLLRSSDVIWLWACVRRWLQHQAGESAFILYIQRFSHQISDFTSTNQRGETTFYKWRNRFVQSQTTVKANRVFAGFFAVTAASLVGQLWQDNIFGVLELFVIQTYQELGGIFEDGWTIKKICVSRQTYWQVYRRPKKQEHSFKDTRRCKVADWVSQLQKWKQKNRGNPELKNLMNISVNLFSNEQFHI